MPHLVDAFTWREYVEAVRDELGGWTDLATAIQDRVPDAVPEDTDSVVKALKRLAKRRNKPGDTYGVLLLRLFGLPPSIQEWGRLMGQYHSRFADLPVRLRREQLQRWDRPPVSETPSAIWVHIGLASLAHRDRDLDEAKRRVVLAGEVRKPELAARIEYELLLGRLASDEGHADEEGEALDRAEALRESDALSEADRLCYQARILDQRAYRASRGWRAAPNALAAALLLYERIPSGSVSPFVAFRRDLGIAWCRWRQGHVEEAAGHARRAYDHAGDGGFVRLRVMALNLMASIADEHGDDGEYRTRARRLAAALDDADLVARVRDHRPGIAAATTP